MLTIAEGYGSRNREAWVPALLRDGGVPTLGSDALTLSTTLDKAWAHRAVAAAGVPVPPHVSVASAEEARTLALPAPYPLFVKPRWEGTAKGIAPTSRVESRDALVARGRARRARLPAARAGGGVHRGRRSTRSPLVGHRPVRARCRRCSARWRPRRGSASTPWSATRRRPAAGATSRRARSTPRSRPRSAALACRAFDALECRDFARADFRLDGAGRPCFLEMNPLPTFAPDGSFGIIAELLGRPLDDLLAEVLGEALARVGLGG